MTQPGPPYGHASESVTQAGMTRDAVTVDSDWEAGLLARARAGRFFQRLPAKRETQVAGIESRARALRA